MALAKSSPDIQAVIQRCLNAQADPEADKRYPTLFEKMTKAGKPVHIFQNKW